MAFIFSVARFKSSRPLPDRPRTMFSAAVSTSTSLKCWCIMPMPRPKASLGERMETSFPSTKIWPSSGAEMPESMVMSVVLPLPFSPSRARISPR